MVALVGWGRHGALKSCKMRSYGNDNDNENGFR
jgi:hypothetical protein